MSQQIVILAAGKGTRMGADVPKVLLPLHDEPVIAHLLNEIKTVPQDTTPIIVVGFKKELVEETLGPDYLYVTQFDQNGTAHAVMSAQSAITAKNFIVLYGDMPFTRQESLLKLIELHNSNHAMISMFTGVVPNFEHQYEHFLGFGRIIRDPQGHIVKIREYKDCTEEEKQITEVNPGIYMFNSEWVFEQLKRVNSENAQHEFYLTDIVELAIQDGQTIYSLPIAAEEIYGINTPAHLEFARKLI
ncbi:MAG TPA: NTP transferase domain-containing protein [Candidatus Doudnabacteria bacterium]|nr:NTP transferase domain-containing protein [Candidatus Doudnabacteria bacterium]